MALDDALFSDLGGAVSSLFSGLGEFQSAAAYKKASSLNLANARVAESSAEINAHLQERNAMQAGGTIMASTAGTGFNLSGSASDILRMQSQQGALAKTLTLQQGELQSQSYAAQAAAEQGQAAAAKLSGGGGIFGGLIKGLGAVASIL